MPSQELCTFSLFKHVVLSRPDNSIQSIRPGSAALETPSLFLLPSLSTSVCPCYRRCPFHSPLPCKMMNLSRCLRQRVSISALPTPRVKRGLSASSIFLNATDKTEVPVASYTKPETSGPNAAERSTLIVDESRPSPKPVPGGDVDRKAVAFEKSIIGKLTPTMKRFTLDGKVAVVTG